MKNLLTLLLLFVFSPVYAGVYEDAMNGKKGVLLYLYTPYCGACKTIAPYFDKAVNTHSKEIVGVKVNAETQYGMSLMQKFKGRYVPYIVLSGPRSGKTMTVDSSCVINELCMERALRRIKN